MRTEVFSLRSTGFACGFVGLGLLASGGCNAVLGLERAEEERVSLGEVDGPDAKAPGDGDADALADAGHGDAHMPPSMPQATGRCIETKEAACKCRSTCEAQRASCLLDPACRLTLQHYAGCLGPSCTDDPGDDKDCFEELDIESQAIGPASSSAKLAECLTECDQPACNSAVASHCESYCGCMLSNCAAAVAPSWPSFQACMSACFAWDPNKVGCLETHCKRGPQDNHCIHAQGLNDACGDATPSTCLSGSSLGGGCDVDPDCCSGLECLSGFCRTK